jgi:hypothetical protein
MVSVRHISPWLLVPEYVKNSLGVEKKKVWNTDKLERRKEEGS